MNLKNKQFPLQIFRAYDIRGKISLLTPEIVQATAYGLVDQYQKAGQTRLVIGYDARLSSPEYAEIIRLVCEEKGLSATILGCCSTPLLYFIARQFDGNGIMLTASHNPKTDNGIKWIIQGEPPCPDKIQQVGKSAIIAFDSLESLVIQPVQHEIVVKYCLEYQHALLNDIQLKRSFKVVLDGLNGSAGRCAALILKKLGCDLTTIRCEANGHFPDHAPDPSQEKHLVKLRNTVLEQQADIGIALDGDGDRLVLIDEKGTIISADRMLSLFAEMCLNTHPGHEVVYDVKCSTMVANTVRHLGGQAKMIRTGSSFLRTYMSQSQGKAVFGGEYAGHYVFNDGRGFGYDDGLYAALRVLEYLSQQPDLTLSQALQAYPERYCTEDTYISTHSIEPAAVLRDVEIKSQALDAQLSKIDGIRLDFEDGFGIIRASNTGEYFTVRFDADNPLRLNHIRHTFVSMLSDRYPQIAQDILDAQ
ncbi:phosphomannomutase/phosphoglucomutase [Acinetobacter bouvetii]|uniref:phosphomannomutase n=1 Tax=Acinetobacter bouvetii TaxID=202951 RepID=A0A811GAW9_9GAMM|nr:phosphomannomutase/phosphoglucomutase [Acinetobacter bouvetii]CAB1210017.1 Phosphomannomutase/phosphoglucomutase [Acinetobacter bouvetii]